ncbi:TPA: hypothetical protein L5599_003521 [Pseudomonas aeruginosa]|uniref:hypothetical protein n=1 Tax=Pseudomonas aeruginosa TaxID=287 RepID=UPI00129C64E6|nr:hypothetical protein [Pseudomonas aeruginosa]MDY1173886.1 hypothetical protein [Pseudomonas aeruginosa]HBP0911849.1 hypothetical protein [Pseudomonas aeruginosa]HBP4659002.1 hypothetical protein [Pseudomonas aeruginosa]
MRIAILIIFAAMLSGCAEQSSPAKPKATPTPRFTFQPTDQQIESAKAVITSMLKDPESARFSGITGVQVEGTPSASAICGNVNAKNSYGGYVGSVPFMVFGDKGQIWESSSRFSVMNQLLTEVCTPTVPAPAAALTEPSPHQAVSTESKERQVYELRQRNLPYEQYQQEYRRIMGQ